jgi:endonuclease/exonuclease/phosphatase family metal-dependent hydrolase
MGRTLRIAAYNFLAGGSARRAQHWATIAAELAPDILLAQEARPPQDDPPFATALWRRASAGWGSGLFAPRLLLQPLALRGFRGWVVGGELRDPLLQRPLRIFSIHCPGGKRSYLDSVKIMLDRLRPLARDADLVLGGDFNVAVGLRGERDEVRMSKGERALFERFDALGLIPAWQTAHPGVPLAQTLRWTGNRATPYHCDGIFIPRAWQRRLASCEVHSGPQWDALSDHNPVLAVVRLP